MKQGDEERKGERDRWIEKPTVRKKKDAREGVRECKSVHARESKGRG